MSHAVDIFNVTAAGEDVCVSFASWSNLNPNVMVSGEGASGRSL